MKILKKISTVLGSVLMIGATMGMAAAASFPAPFIAGGAADAAIVVGDAAAKKSDADVGCTHKQESKIAEPHGAVIYLADARYRHIIR